MPAIFVKTLKYMETLKNGEIQLYDNYIPALQLGDYAITVEQRLEEDGLNAIFERSQDFTVIADRFRLSANAVHTHYPPPDGQGDFESVLPQIVLADCSLPWSHSADGRTPSLAVLLFEVEELSVADWSKVTRTGAFLTEVTALKKPPFGKYLQPNLKTMPHENDKETCFCVELTAAYFNEIVPRTSELPYLAHVRAVNATDKSDTNNQEWFATLFANRLPQPKSRNIAHLVSLEGFENYLKADAPPIDAALKVRLASLASWEFYCEAPKEEFAVQMQQLLDTHDTLRLTAENVQNPTIKTALAGGYVPLAYETQQGERTMAWYRSPLAPTLLPERNSASSFTAESAMIYDPETGIFDLTYAVAWQTGRLLALADAGFSQALLEWKQRANLFLDRFFARKTFYANILKIVNEQLALEGGAEFTLEDLMGNNLSQKSLVLFSAVKELGLTARGNLTETRTADKLTEKARQSLNGLAGILSPDDFKQLEKQGDIYAAVLAKLMA